MTNSWDHVYIPNPTLGDGYVSVIKQIWVKIRCAIMCAVPENNLANIVLEYANIDDFYVFSRVLGIHSPGVVTLTSYAYAHKIYLGLQKHDFLEHSM